MAKDTAPDPGRELRRDMGEQVTSNRHLRLFTYGLGGLVLVLLIIVVRIAGVAPPSPS